MAKKRGRKQASAATTSKTSTETINTEVITPALSSVAVLLKVCRLCEAKDGPFLNIFDADKITAKKIDELMPFVIAENDDLPHKICFRCSAKVEELYEFILKCVNTQNNLQSAMGKKGPLLIKTKTRVQWEENLNKSLKMSNDDICDALIKKAMADIGDIQLNPKLIEEDDKPLARKGKVETMKKDEENKGAECKNEDTSGTEVALKQAKLATEKVNQKIPAKTLRSSTNNIQNSEGKSDEKNESKSNENNESKTRTQRQAKVSNAIKKQVKKIVNNDDDTDKQKVVESPKVAEPEKKTEPPFNIMDYVSRIKVNGVGILFQCKLCNKNFLKMEVVESHGCAKNAVPKVDFIKHVPAPQLPKAPTVKYIKMDGNSKKNKDVAVDNNQKKPEPKEAEKPETKAPPPPTLNPKPKPKIGPASKVKRASSPKPKNDISEPRQSLTENDTKTPVTTAEANQASPVVSFPGLPKLNSRYSLVPGPNNTFTLVEDPNYVAPAAVTEAPKPLVKRPNAPGPKSKKVQKPPSPEIIDLDDTEQTPSGQPYPVGLFKTSHTSAYVPPVNEPPIFTTPAMKKQSYTVVQTGNPSKLLISTKPVPPVEEPPKKRQKKSKHEVKDDRKEPFNVTIEDTAPAKDPGFFTFINVDPLLQPSYVLPTDNIIQESQISTSTQVVGGAQTKEKENTSKKYSCNMCGEQFSREKKLLSHIQSHYTKMDEEDQKREEMKSKKRKLKS